MALFTKMIVLLFCIMHLTGCKPSRPTNITIGIIEPLEHRAMDDIVAGFSETLHKLYQKPVTIKIENAQNDTNLERAIIQKMHDAQYTMIVPIGVGATQMSLSMVRDSPVISLASDLSENDRKNPHPCHAVAVHDEISPKQLLEFIHAVYPTLTRLTLIHSAADKVFPQVKETITAGKEYGMTIDHLMVSSLPELYGFAQALPAQTQGIFILKDNMIVSGISVLSNIAASKHIPLMTSDQGSVQNGAAFALGVHEREIGVQGAMLAVDVLNGKAACQLPIVKMKNLTVFINQNALEREEQPIAPILQSAKRFHYQTEMIASH